LKFSVIKFEETVMVFEEMVIKMMALSSPIIPRFPRFEVLVMKYEVFSEGIK